MDGWWLQGTLGTRELKSPQEWCHIIQCPAVVSNKWPDGQRSFSRLMHSAHSPDSSPSLSCCVWQRWLTWVWLEWEKHRSCKVNTVGARSSKRVLNFYQQYFLQSLQGGAFNKDLLYSVWWTHIFSAALLSLTHTHTHLPLLYWQNTQGSTESSVQVYALTFPHL